MLQLNFWCTVQGETELGLASRCHPILNALITLNTEQQHGENLRLLFKFTKIRWLIKWVYKQMWIKCAKFSILYKKHLLN